MPRLSARRSRGGPSWIQRGSAAALALVLSAGVLACGGLEEKASRIDGLRTPKPGQSTGDPLSAGALANDPTADLPKGVTGGGRPGQTSLTDIPPGPLAPISQLADAGIPKGKAGGSRPATTNAVPFTKTAGPFDLTTIAYATDSLTYTVKLDYTIDPATTAALPTPIPIPTITTEIGNQPSRQGVAGSEPNGNRSYTLYLAGKTDTACSKSPTSAWSCRKTGGSGQATSVGLLPDILPGTTSLVAGVYNATGGVNGTLSQRKILGVTARCGTWAANGGIVLCVNADAIPVYVEIPGVLKATATAYTRGVSGALLNPPV